MFIGLNLCHVHVKCSVRDFGGQHFIPRSKTEPPREAMVIAEYVKKACLPALVSLLLMLHKLTLFLLL